MATALDNARSDCERFTKRSRDSAMDPGSARAAASRMFKGSAFEHLFTAKTQSNEYEKFRDWSYVAINAIAKRAARQNPRLARGEPTVDKAALFSKEYNAKGGFSRVLSASQKSLIFDFPNCPPHIKSRAESGIVMIDRHGILDAIAHPNDLMTKWGLFYVTIASLELTGRAYWWFYKAKNKDVRTGQEIYIWPIPSNWVTPVSDENGGIHYKYKVHPPGSAEPFEIPAQNMAPFVLPDPANPTQHISPMRTQSKSVDLDDLIQTAQNVAMKQGIFPGVVLTTGRLPDSPGGLPGQRPVLTPEQRRDIITAIRAAYQGVRNFNEPFIIDGLIEDVKPFTNKPIEMAFLDSGKDVKSRIFGAYGLNPIVIGEIAGANRAQAAVAEDNFVSNVINPLLEMIGEVITVWIGRNSLFSDFGSSDDIFLWIDPAEAHDADLEIARWRLGLRFQAVYRNEFRTNVLRLPPKPEFESPPPGKVQGGDEGENEAGSSDEGSTDNNSLPGTEITDRGENSESGQ